MNKIKKLEAFHQKCMEQYGWYSHCVPTGDNTPFGFNYHTHGVEKSFNHPNIQVVFPLNHEIVHSIVSIVIDRIKAGEKFVPNKDYSEIIGNNLMVRFVEAKECGRSVLRLVFPDAKGEFTGKFAKQFELLDNEAELPERDID